ncbi:hypothetical protein [Mesoplasma coleopterae]|uniref:Uncharacterized protein n=1 Tax=Mesoplasma coleopterae TaxID=324078 RepID=A0A2K8P2A0_9MOLU|nr:hypothetical protein [Mesoplasma coleopterae]ATZ20877.1 hypothetical protein MCOLE_v1c03630 [Mesoplasma coleopterae]AVN62377.1 hypothetical protein CG001_01805 [Mesoplasma coleopterae]AVN63062.1 hypothetical protein CG000_01950 [Mesoplasma coleopterae]
MKYKNLEIKNNSVKLNKYQSIHFNFEGLQNKLKEIKFPVLILDTEFFNRSHDFDNIEPKLYGEKEKDIVYLMNYSFAKSFNEIQSRNNHKSINSLSIKRKVNDDKYDFKSQYQSMIKSFINMCINKNIRTIIFAGQDNDKKIIEQWINTYKALFKNKKTDLFIFNKDTKKYRLNSFDIYDALEQNLSFANYLKDGTKFYNEQNLKKGDIEDSIKIRSLKKFFDYTEELHSKYNFKEDNITFLCSRALKLFSLEKVSQSEHDKLSKSLKEARSHCYDDVLKILVLIKFLSYIMNKQMGETWASV